MIILVAEIVAYAERVISSAFFISSRDGCKIKMQNLVVKALHLVVESRTTRLYSLKIY